MTDDELFYDMAHSRAEEQGRRKQHFDIMASTILALSGALSGIMAFTVSEWASWTIGLAIVVLGAFLGVGVSTLKVIHIRKWHRRPKLSKIYERLKSGKEEEESVIRWTAQRMTKAADHNEKLLTNKAIWWRRTYSFLIVQVVVLGMLILSVGV